MIKVKLSDVIWKDLLTKDFQIGPMEVTAGIPANAEIVDIDWNHEDELLEIVFDVGDGDLDIHDFAICWTLGL